MQIDLDYASPVDLAESQHVAALFRYIHDAIEREGVDWRLVEFETEFDGVRHCGEYEVLEWGRQVRVLLISVPTPRGSFDEDYYKQVTLDDGEIVGSA